MAVDLSNHLIGKTLPAPPGMRARLARFNGKHGIEEQHSLPSPPLKRSSMGAIMWSITPKF